ncbi:hypothetical protein HZA75_04345 [Candidatus Roizmanbacteria bacterium]|nr:hypothetical protein [Candidatus Roizmanbacteria bacterium]
MDNSNIKVYLGISFALIVLFILILIIPFSKKPSPFLQPTPYNPPTPTSIEINPLINSQSPTSIPADFTGVAEEELSPEVLDVSQQKKDLRQKTPLDLSTFIIDFDYGEDKFVVTLKDPKDQAQREFENWRTVNYPGLGNDQFVLK